MADGTLVFGANLNASCLTSRAKKVNSSSSSISVAANMRRKTRQSNRRDIHNRVTLWHAQSCCVYCNVSSEQARERRTERVFLFVRSFSCSQLFTQLVSALCLYYSYLTKCTIHALFITLRLPAYACEMFTLAVWNSWWSCVMIAGRLGEGPGHHCLQQQCFNLWPQHWFSGLSCRVGLILYMHSVSESILEGIVHQKGK